MIIENPYHDLSAGQWLRGNLHAHTTRSDGRRSPQEVIDDYAARGYGFLMLSDHDNCATEAVLAGFNPHGMVLIPGNEISDNGPHMLHVHADRTLTPHAQRQRVLNDAAAVRGFIIACHPNWHADFNHTTIAQLSEWVGYAGIEIYNGVINRLEGSPYALDKWDMLLSRGRRLWGFGNDDSHWANGDSGIAWNMAYAKEKSVTGVVNALTAGRFYVSTGVTLRSVTASGPRLRIETEDAERIVAVREHGRRFASADAPALEVEAPDGAPYVRFECYGRGERTAWTQPLYLKQEE